jgi:hypothetical protein
MWGQPNPVAMVFFALLTFVVVMGEAIASWKRVAGLGPPRTAVAVFALWLTGRLVLDCVRIMGFRDWQYPPLRAPAPRRRSAGTVPHRHPPPPERWA